MTMKEATENILELCKELDKPIERNMEILERIKEIDVCESECEQLLHKMLYYSKKKKSENMTIESKSNSYYERYFSLNSNLGITRKHTNSGIRLIDTKSKTNKTGLSISSSHFNAMLKFKDFDKEKLLRWGELLGKYNSLSEQKRYRYVVMSCTFGDNQKVELENNNIHVFIEDENNKGEYDKYDISNPISCIRQKMDYRHREEGEGRTKLLLKLIDLCDLFYKESDNILKLVIEKKERTESLKQEIEKEIAPFLMMEELRKK